MLTKEQHRELGRLARKDCVAIMTPGFTIVGRDMLANHPGFPPELMAEAMMRAGVELMLEHEPRVTAVIALLDILAEVKKQP